MRLGFLQVYNEVNWVDHQIDQAMLLCDKLLITEGSQFAAFPDISERSDDGTLDIIHDKIKEYPKQIILNETIREHKNYRRNQCANYNRALDFCEVGDYILAFDADEFYLNSYIEYLNDLMEEGKADAIFVCGRNFAFSFDWQLLVRDNDISCTRVIFKKTPKLFFVPTSQPRNLGKRVVSDKSVIGRFHYVWLKPKSRLRIRHRTSGFFPGMLKWFDDNWDSIKLIDEKKHNHYGGYFRLRKFNDKHPEILDNHPWRHIKDVREIT